MTSLSIKHGPTQIYCGFGSWGLSVDQTEEMLISNGIDSRSIKRVTNFVNLTKETKLAVVPGGMAGLIAGELESQKEKIQKYVREGGRYFGICAGGILASQSMISKPQAMGPWNSEKIQELFSLNRLVNQYQPYMGSFSIGLYPGNCIAPHLVKTAASGADLNNFCSAPVYFPSEDTKTGFERFYITHYSGPVFYQLPEGAKTLLHYEDPIDHFEVGQVSAGTYSITSKIEDPSPAACISYPFGSGKMVLSGVHPELNPLTFPSCAKKHEFDAAFPDLVTSSEASRQKLIHEIFKELE